MKTQDEILKESMDKVRNLYLVITDKIRAIDRPINFKIIIKEALEQQRQSDLEEFDKFVDNFILEQKKIFREMEEARPKRMKTMNQRNVGMLNAQNKIDCMEEFKEKLKEVKMKYSHTLKGRVS